MINNTAKESSDFQLKQEGLSISTDHHDQKPKVSSSSSLFSPSSSSSSQWLRLNKDPRIVRVSRALGGKDRHSKVCTIRGLRDRRVRLSVPTAIHLYDLQDRLGLSQPSKVVDWLLNAAKNEIDELPPLPISPGNFNFTLGYHPSSLGTTTTATTTSDNNNDDIALWNKSKSKEVMVSSIEEDDIDDHKHGGSNNQNCAPSAQHGLPNNNNLLVPGGIINHHHHPASSFLGLLNTMPMPLGGYQLEHNNNSNSNNNSGEVAQLGNQLGLLNQTDLHHHGHGNSVSVVPFPSSTLGTTSQILLCSPNPSHGGATQSYFPSQVAAMEMDPRVQMSHYHHYHHQNLSTNSVFNPFMSLARMNPKLLHLPNNSSESQSHNEEQDFPSK